MFHIPNYNLISSGKHCSLHGGLAVYLRDDYRYKICKASIRSDFWESLTVRVLGDNNTKDIYLCNIYRPPREHLNNEALNNFFDQLNISLNDLTVPKSIVTILGDFNIGLLKYNKRAQVKEFLDNMMSYGFQPSITFRTRLTDLSATLIDNVFSNHLITNFDLSGILVSGISDPLPYFHIINSSPTYSSKMKLNNYTRKYSPEAINKLYAELETVNFDNLFTMDLDHDPNVNYNIL
jgi:hypothetical protein